MPMSGLRQTSTMRSTKLLALEAIRRHFTAYGCAPSYGELYAAIGVEPSRMSAIMRELEADKLIIRQPGVPRGVLLPEPLANASTSELMLELQRRGCVVRLTAATDPLGVVASEFASQLVPDVASGTIQQLPDDAVLSDLLAQLEEVPGGEAGGEDTAGDERGDGSQPDPQGGAQASGDGHSADGAA